VNYDPTEEYELMTRAGMTFPQILASLTTAPAETFGASQHLGRIAPGFDADLTILAGDPQQNPHALTAVRYTISRGRIIYRATN
jgi:imidazolonepropionase-like amidohydrolase